MPDLVRQLLGTNQMLNTSKTNFTDLILSAGCNIGDERSHNFDDFVQSLWNIENFINS